MCRKTIVASCYYKKRGKMKIKPFLLISGESVVLLLFEMTVKYLMN